MKAQIVKASALVAVATLASWGAYAQDEAPADLRANPSGSCRTKYG